MRAVARCPICSAADGGRVFEELPEVRRCGGCGFVFHAGGPLQSAYDQDYFARDGYRSYFERAAQWRYEARVRLRWLLADRAPARLLEVGCAGGFFVAEARRRGIEATGVEVSAIAARYAREQLAVPVVEAAFEDAAAARDVDVVCAFHVLEHVEDPRRFLTLACERLAPGGTLALEVPNIAAARARREGAGSAALQPWTHRWHFAPQTLAELVRQCGFRVERVDTAFARLYRRPADRLSLGLLAHAVADGRAARSLRVTHPRLGDNLRLIGRAA